MRIGSLFSGVGGLELGLEWSGLGATIWQIELDPFCRKVLAYHWPHVRRFEDVTETDPHQAGVADIICGGFPCQDISSAGKRTGLAGSRSGLWTHFARFVAELRPRWVVVENVASGAKLWVDAVCTDLEQLGYETLPVPLSAQDVGAPHLRRRIFIVARNTNMQSKPAQPVNAQVAVVQSDTGLAPDPQRQQLREQPWRRRRSCGSGTAFVGQYGAGWGLDTMPEPALRRVDDGATTRVDRSVRRRRSNRLKALGNAVVPQCAEVIGWMIREIEVCDE